MSKSKRYILTALAALLLLLCASLWLLTRGGNTDTDGIWLVTRPTGDFTSISIQHQDGRALTLTRTQDTWALQDGEAVSRERMAPLLAALGYLKATHRVEDAQGQLDQYGLSIPQLTIAAAYTDDQADRFAFGSPRLSGGVYMTYGTDGTVYHIDEQRGRVFTAAAAAFTELPLDQIALNRLVGVNIKTADHGEISLRLSEAPRAGGDFYWSLAKPYPCTAQADAVEDILSAVHASASVVKVQDPDQPETYGIIPDSPRLILYDTFDRGLELQFGSRDGDTVYCTVDAFSGVYRISADILNALDRTPESLVDSSLYTYEVPSVTACTMEWGSRVFRLRAEWVDIGESGQKAQRFYLDDSPLAGADYHDIAQRIGAVRCDGVFTQAPALGDEMGALRLQRLSAPHEETISFREWPDYPDMVGVLYNDIPVTYVQKAHIEQLMLLLSDCAGGLI